MCIECLKNSKLIKNVACSQTHKVPFSLLFFLPFQLFYMFSLFTLQFFFQFIFKKNDFPNNFSFARTIMDFFFTEFLNPKKFTERTCGSWFSQQKEKKIKYSNSITISKNKVYLSRLGDDVDVRHRTK